MLMSFTIILYIVGFSMLFMRLQTIREVRIHLEAQLSRTNGSATEFKVSYKRGKRVQVRRIAHLVATRLTS